MARFTEVSEEEIKTAFCYPSDLATIRVGEEWWIHTLTLRISVYIPPLFSSPSGDSCMLFLVQLLHECLQYLSSH